MEPHRTQEDLLTNLETLELAVIEVPVARIADMTGLGLFTGSIVESVGRRKEAVAEAG